MHIPNHTTSSTPNTPNQTRSAPLDNPTPPEPTQILTFPIRPSATIADPSTPNGQRWSQILDIIQGWEGFKRLHWGRHAEEGERWRVEVVVVREKLENHYSFLTSPLYQSIQTTLLPPLLPPRKSPLDIEHLHALLSNFTQNPSTLSSAPVTGTAIYSTTSRTGWEKTWALWTTLVPYVPGCLGCTGGWIVDSPLNGNKEGEPKEAKEYIVYVGWESIKHHDDYHHTKDFRQKRVILAQHNTGWRGYGHVGFWYGRGTEKGEVIVIIYACL
ncbi:hypothetical protein BDV12DRAFT_210257 [Aspergillus spectabilis]